MAWRLRVLQKIWLYMLRVVAGRSIMPSGFWRRYLCIASLTVQCPSVTFSRTALTTGDLLLLLHTSTIIHSTPHQSLALLSSMLAWLSSLYVNLEIFLFMSRSGTSDHLELKRGAFHVLHGTHSLGCSTLCPALIILMKWGHGSASVFCHSHCQLHFLHWSALLRWLSGHLVNTRITELTSRITHVSVKPSFHYCCEHDAGISAETSRRISNTPESRWLTVFYLTVFYDFFVVLTGLFLLYKHVAVYKFAHSAIFYFLLCVIKY